MNSRQKGKRGELELSGKFRDYGYDCRRGQQYCGLNGNADVVGLPGIHVECKRVEKLNIHDAVNQAIRDNVTKGSIPIVAHRKNRTPWLITMTADDWFKLFYGLEVNEDE